MYKQEWEGKEFPNSVVFPIRNHIVGARNFLTSRSKSNNLGILES